MENFDMKLTIELITEMCAKNPKLRASVSELEKTLIECEQLRAAKKRMEPELCSLKIDLMLLRELDAMIKEGSANSSTCNALLQKGYEQLLQMEMLLNDDKVKNISRYDMLRKQNDVQEELDRMEKQQKAESMRNAGLENRQIVKDLRKAQRKLQEAKVKLQQIEIEGAQLDRLWKPKLERVTKLRNDKIVSLVKLAKQNQELREKLKLPNMQSLSLIGKECTQPNPPQPRSHFVMLSVSDFLKKYPEEPATAEADAPPLRSILISNNRSEECAEPSSTVNKQVHFAPAPITISNEDTIQEDETTSLTFEDMHPDIEISSENEFNITENKSHPHQVIIEKVEVLPPISMANLTMLQLSPPPMPVNVDKGDALKNVNTPKCTKSGEFNLEKFFTYSLGPNTGNGEQNEEIMESTAIAEQDDILMVNTNSEPMSFSTSGVALNDDFFLDLSDDDGNSDQTNNNHAYVL